MAANSKIEWTHSTFNPHWGCARVSPGCEHCYAETFAHRLGLKVWGANADRREFGDKHWTEPLKWDKAAAKAGERHRVFCASMADVFEDHPVAQRSRDRLWPLIKSTPNLDWLLLTKRPENIARMLPADWGTGYANVWLGTTVEDRKRKGRIDELRAVPAAIHFLSLEPLLEDPDLGDDDLAGIDWVIVGGESGHGARRFDVTWARSIISQCRAAGVAVHVKQLGAFVVDRNDAFDTCSVPPEDDSQWPWHDRDPDDIEDNINGFREEYQGAPVRVHLRDKKGGDWNEWPADLRVREYPIVREVCQ